MSGETPQRPLDLNQKIGKAIDRIAQPLAKVWLICFIIGLALAIGGCFLFPHGLGLPHSLTEAQLTEAIVRWMTNSDIPPAEAAEFAADPEVRRLTRAMLQGSEQNPWATGVADAHLESVNRRIEQLRKARR